MFKKAVISAYTAMFALIILSASPPGLVNYQGVLRDDAGAPISGNRDMVFTFYSAPVGGDQILLDSHSAADGNPVPVTNGLFTVQLGGGLVSDGAGPGNYTSLAPVFRDYGSVYMAVTVGGEVLSPRVQVVSSAYAQNAKTLDGNEVSAFAPATHVHSGGDITSGSVSESYIDPAVARDTEVMPTVLANDGPGSTLDADTLDGQHASAFMGSATDNWVNTTGDTMTGTLALSPSSGYAGISSNISSGAPLISLANSGNGLAINAVTTGLGAVISATNNASSSVEGTDFFGILGEANGDNLASNTGIMGSASLGDSNCGVTGKATGGQGYRTGVYGSAEGSNAGPYQSTGGSFSATSSGGTNYGVYATAANGATNWAGYFLGNVNVNNGELFTTASSTSRSGLNIPHGTAPTTPANGDIWTTSGGLYTQINGSTVGPLTSASGHNHDSEYVNTTGDTMTGRLILSPPSGTGGISSDISSTGPIISLINNGNGTAINSVTTGLGAAISAINNASSSVIGTDFYGILGEANGDNFASNTGIMGSSSLGDNNCGVTGKATGNQGNRTGVYGSAEGSNTGPYQSTGGSFSATSSGGTNYGVYATAANGATNWAGYFLGNVNVNNGELFTAASSTSRSGLNIPHGTAPTAPVNGDLWTTTGGLYARINGATVGPFTGTGFDHGALSGLYDDDHTQYFNLSQSETVNGIPAFNGGTSGSTAPFTVDSNYLVSNLNADLLDGQQGSYYLDTSATTQTKAGKVIFNAGAGDYGVEGYGPTAGGYFKDYNSTDTGYAYIGYGHYGVYASGNWMGGYFQSGDGVGTGYSYIGRRSPGTPNTYWGITSFGDDGGGYFQWNYGTATQRAYAYLGHTYDPGTGPEYLGVRAYGSTAGGYFKDYEGSGYAYIGYDTAKVQGTGANNFVQNHPVEKDKVIVYSSPEGDEVATYTRGTSRLVDGEARVKLGATFQWVTNPDIGLTAHLTPRGEAVPLAVQSLSTTELLVTGPRDVAFDYIVYGLRIGFEETAPVQKKKEESWIPSMKNHRDLFTNYPDLRAYTALERFKGMEAETGSKTAFDFSASRVLRDAIHEFDPAADTLPEKDHALEPGEAAADERVARPSTAGTIPDTGAVPQHVGAAASSTPNSMEYRTAAGEFDAVAMGSVPQPQAIFTAKDAVERGDVLVLNPANGEELYLCQRPSDPMVVGISGGDAKAFGELRLFQYGTAWVKVDAQYGPIARGDLLTSSSTPGHAMKSPMPAEQGTVIGKALESLASGTGLIKVLVTLR